MKKINQFISLLAMAITIASCSNLSSDSKSAGPDTLKIDSASTNVKSESTTNSTIYASVDSSFDINSKRYNVKVTQYDLTELAHSKGDTLSRPVYVIALKIFDSSDKLIFNDSLDATSWGYPGKIKRISEYQIAFPQLTNVGNEIIAAFNVWEDSSMDMISGSVAFDVVSNKPRYFFNEALMEE